MGHSPNREDSLAADLLVDSICERYEAELRAGHFPTIAEYLADVPTAIHAKLTEELQKLHAAHQGPGTLAYVPTAEPVALESQYGPYTLVQPLGEGGMGEVWVARQEQPVRRTVALKLIRGGLDSDAVLLRFEQERQTLAHLDHPNIARVLDAGTTALGRPYFVMELIDGKRFNAYCDAAKLDMLARLRLFLDLCHAVQHAHQKGVIHRDLKPGNILVAEVDGRPIVKVIDFGVAKVLGGEGTDQLIATQAGSVVGTWEYMAPEQAGTTANDIDTRADVYSLGVILYELLTGLRPFDSQRLRQAPVDEAIRILREEDPPRPSTRLSQSTAASASVPSVQITQLRGDLDWVVMKCLEKDRSRRYESAASLAREVERYLANEPVEARPPSTAYWVRKFVRRNRVAVSVGTVVMLALAVGTAAIVWGYFEAKAATAQTKQSLAEVSFANDTIFGVFKDFDIRRVRQGSDPLEYVLAERLVAAANHLTPETIRDPATRVRLQLRMGLTLLSLDRPRDAIPLFQQALDTQKILYGEDHPDTWEATSNLAEAYREAGRSNEAFALYEDVHKKTEAKFGPDNAKSAITLSNLAAAYIAIGQPQTALPLYDQCLQWRTKNLGESDADTILSMNNLAACYVAVGQRLKSIPLYEQALALRTAKLGEDHADTLLSLNNLASTYEMVGRLDDALPLLEQALALHKTKLGPDHRQTLVCMGNLASVYRRKGRLPEAVALYEQTSNLQRARLGLTHPDTLLGINNLADIYRLTNQLDKAIPLFEEALTLQMKQLGAEHPDTLMTMNNFAFAYHTANAVEKAIPLYEQSLELRRKRNGNDHPETMASMGNLAVAYADAHRGEQAATLFAEFVKLKRTKVNANELPFAATLSQIGTYLLNARQYAAAEPYFRQSLAIREKLAADKWGTANACSQVGRSLAGQGRHAEAESFLVTGYEGLLKHRTKIPRTSANTVFETGVCLVELYEATQQYDKAQSLRGTIPHEIAPSPRDAK